MATNVFIPQSQQNKINAGLSSATDVGITDINKVGQPGVGINNSTAQAMTNKNTVGTVQTSTPAPTYLNKSPTLGQDTGVQGEMSYTNWKVANPNGTYDQWKSTLPGGSLSGDVTSQYAATQQLANEVGPVSDQGPSPQQQKMIDAINQFNENFGKQMNMNIQTSAQQTRQNIGTAANPVQYGQFNQPNNQNFGGQGYSYSAMGGVGEQGMTGPSGTMGGATPESQLSQSVMNSFSNLKNSFQFDHFAGGNQNP
jgi:hypothetical protein